MAIGKGAKLHEFVAFDDDSGDDFPIDSQPVALLVFAGIFAKLLHFPPLAPDPTPRFPKFVDLMPRPLEIAHVVIALGAASCAAASLAPTLGAAALWDPLVFWIGAAAGWTYTFQRWWKWRRNPADLAPDRRAAFEGSPWAGLIVWTSIFLAASCTLIAHAALDFMAFLPWAAGGGLLAAAYATFPIRFPGGLRGVPGLKLPLIALAWAWATVALPLLGTGSWHALSWAVALGQFLFIAGLTIPFDIRDLAQDPPGLRTLPQWLGAHESLRIALILLAASAAIFVQTPDQTGRMALSLIALPIVAFGPVPRREAYYTWLLDGLLILQGPLVVLL